MKLEYVKQLGIVSLLVFGGAAAFAIASCSGGAARSPAVAEASGSSGTDVAPPPPPLATSTPEMRAVPEAMRKYENSNLHFSFLYPPNLQLHTFSEGGGAFTVALQDPTTNEGIEAYVTPYSGTQITEARFKLDEPSGVIQERTDVMIDGVRATMFYGNNPIMGDTREVWFIKGGLLFEVTTYKQLDSWLAQIMQTWQFTP